MDVWVIYIFLTTVNNVTVNIGIQVSESLLLILSCVHPEVEMLGHMVILCWSSWETAKLFSMTLFCTLTGNAQVFLFLHILANAFFVFIFKNNYHNIGIKYYLPVVLIIISLMTSDVEHLFMCLLVISISSLRRCLCNSFVHFQIEVFISYCWVLEVVYVFYLYQVFELHIFSPIKWTVISLTW